MCGTKKASCKNKDSGSVGEPGTQNINAGRSAFERHQIAMEKSRQEISEFIGTIGEEQKNKILLELLSNEVCSMQKIWLSLVVLFPHIPLPSHHGALVVFADQCQVRKRTNVVEKSSVSHHM